MSSAPVLDERKHRAVLDPLVEASVGAGRVYDYGTVPGADGNAGTLPPIFVLPSLERRFVQPQQHGLAGRSGWRVTFRYAGRTVAEARWAAAKVAEAVDEKRLVIDGVQSTPVTHETTQAIAFDSGRFSGWASYTYAL